jgi:hypothetical protein
MGPLFNFYTSYSNRLPLASANGFRVSQIKGFSPNISFVTESMIVEAPFRMTVYLKLQSFPSYKFGNTPGDPSLRSG